MTSALRGHLHLTCERDGAGRTCLARQSFAAPMHLSKPHWDGHILVVNAVNPTAGLFSGDTVETAIHAGPGASALLTSPSASRIHRARGSEPAAMVRQTFSAAEGAWLDVCPEILIPHAGARYAQESRLEVAHGGALFFLDCLAPGRVASGEIFAFESIHCRVRLTVDGELLALENCRLSSADNSLLPLRVHHPHSYYAGWFAIFRNSIAPGPLLRALAALSGGTIATAASALNPRAITGKILAADSPSMRRAVAAVRELVYSQAGRPLPLWRKM